VPSAWVELKSQAVTEEWNGEPLTLEAGENAAIPQTPNGSTVFAYQNMAAMNNSGSLLLTSNQATQPLTVPAQTNQVLLAVGNWMAYSLSVANTSAQARTPIRIQLIGPGIPGITPTTLVPDGPVLTLKTGQCAQGIPKPRYMQLVMQNPSGDASVIALIGGPPDLSGNNAYIFGLNYSQNTGPGTGITPPSPFYATASGINYLYQFNWGSDTLFCANLSAESADPVLISLRSL
jgi:hypothetical protein